RQRGDQEWQQREFRIGAAVRIHHLPRLFERGYVIFLDEREMLDAPVCLRHVLGDLAAQADDLDGLVSAGRSDTARRNRAAVVEQIGVEIRVADAVARGLYLAKVDAEVACAGSHGGRGED